MPDWLPPETWQVGDNLDAATLNRRIRDQMTVLLRRPMTILTRGAAQSIASGANTVIQWDTIVQDDDGMCMAGTPVTNIYAQRDGTYQVWMNTCHQSNGTNPLTLQASIWISDNSNLRRWDYQSKGSSGIDHCRSITGTFFLNAGEFFTAHCYQDTGAAQNLEVFNNTPRLIIMWLGIS